VTSLPDVSTEPARAKSPSFNLRAEHLSQFRRYGEQLHWQLLSRHDNGENNSVRPPAKKSLLRPSLDSLQSSSCFNAKQLSRNAANDDINIATMPSVSWAHQGERAFRCSPILQVNPLKLRKPRSAASESAHHSVGARVRPAVWRVIRTTKAVAIEAAASETTSSAAKVISAYARRVTSAKATHVTSAKATHVTSAKATHVTSAKATHVASAKAAHVTSATTTVSSTTTTATAGLCTSGKKAAGKHSTCQNHHHSSSHDILLWDGRTFRHRVDAGVSEEEKCQRRDGLKMGRRICRLH
jgi:hypothetical protein